MLTLSDYRPNWNEPRIRARTLDVLAWCEQKLIGTKRPKPIHSKEIRKVFGNTDQHGLAQWLRANLLSRVSTRFEPNKFLCLYSLNQAGYERVYRLIGLPMPDKIDVLREKFADVLAGGPVEYSDKGSRRYHEFQNVPREDRKAVCDGWWDYDIETAAPSLVLQYATAYFLERERPAILYSPDNPFPAVARMVHDKAAVRQHVAELVGVDIATAKKLLMLVFSRAHPAPRSKNPLFSALGCDRVLLYKFLNDDFIKMLRRDVGRMWGFAFLRAQRDQTRLLLAGEKPVKLPSKQGAKQSAIYRSLERKVMNVIESQLEVQGVVPFLIHDGFMCRVRVDTETLIRAVKDQTGYEIRLSEAQLWKTAEAEPDEPDIEELMDGLDYDEDTEFEVAA